MHQLCYRIGSLFITVELGIDSTYDYIEKYYYTGQFEIRDRLLKFSRNCVKNPMCTKNIMTDW